MNFRWFNSKKALIIKIFKPWSGKCKMELEENYLIALVFAGFTRSFYFGLLIFIVHAKYHR